MAPPRHPPPPIAWSGQTPPKGSATSLQPARAFSTHQRPQGQRESSPGDELVPLSGGEFRLKSHERHVLSAPSGSYNFVRVQGLTRNQATTMLSSQAPHAALAKGRPVLYAGTAAFEGGKLAWWSNYSGTYQPLAEFSSQAALPQDRFIPWQKLQMGGLGMQRGMLSDHRRPQAPQQQDIAKPEVKAEAKAGTKSAKPGNSGPTETR